MDLIGLQSKIRFWEQDQKLFIPVEEQESTEAQTSSKPSSSAVPKDTLNLESEIQTMQSVELESFAHTKVDISNKSADKESSSVDVEKQLSTNPSEDISLANIDGVLQKLAANIQKDSQHDEEIFLEEIIVDKDPISPILGETIIPEVSAQQQATELEAPITTAATDEVPIHAVSHSVALVIADKPESSKVILTNPESP